jgi:hypothetical protein
MDQGQWRPDRWSVLRPEPERTLSYAGMPAHPFRRDLVSVQKLRAQSTEAKL